MSDALDQLVDRIAAKLVDLAPPPSTSPNLLKGDQLCARLNISQSTLTRWRRSGMPAQPMGRNYRYDLAAVVEWLKGRAA